MIGIKVQNFIWEKALLDLLGSDAEKYQTDHSYCVIITESEMSNDKPTLILGKDILLPFCFDNLKGVISKAQEPHFENVFFKWLPQKRQLIHKKNHKIIQLTEKESDIIKYLTQCKKNQAPKDEILKAVWHYQNDIHTHTLESHIYALRQKIGPDHDKIIMVQDNFYTLI